MDTARIHAVPAFHAIGQEARRAPIAIFDAIQPWLSMAGAIERNAQPQ